MDHVNADPTDTESLCDAGEILIDMDQPRQAAALFAAVLARDAKNARALEGMRRLNGLPADDTNDTRPATPSTAGNNS
jgi:thioredoxin-like negative regulator of GroEL